MYGSRVKNAYKDNSDIDIAVEFDQKMISATENSSGMAAWICEQEAWKNELQIKIPIKVHLEWLHPQIIKILKNGVDDFKILIADLYKEAFSKHGQVESCQVNPIGWL